jgi:hypothetical protein
MNIHSWLNKILLRKKLEMSMDTNKHGGEECCRYGITTDYLQFHSYYYYYYY